MVILDRLQSCNFSHSGFSFLQISKDEHFDANTFAFRVPNLFTSILNCLSANKVLLDEDLPNKNNCQSSVFFEVCFVLFFEENIRFFSLENTSGMWYHRETNMLWKAACEQFGGSVLRFYSGWKHTGQIISSDSKPRIFDPTNSNIVFVVPSETTIDYFKPGINEQVIDLAVQSKPDDAAFCLKFDGHQHEENMIPIPLLVFHIARAFGNIKSLVNLITK